MKNPTSDFKSALSENAAEVTKMLDDLLPVIDTPEARVIEAMRYSSLEGGKRVRPFLVTQSAALFGVDRVSALRAAADGIALVYCANTSVGVTLLGKLVEQVAAQLVDGWDIEILEAHHNHKVDAPSGTALALGEAAARGRGVKLDDVADMVRKGQTGARRTGDIGFAVLRGGDVTGEHSVIFYGDSERVEISHRATDRAIFARGALRAARFASGAKTGFYNMEDVLAG